MTEQTTPNQAPAASQSAGGVLLADGIPAAPQGTNHLRPDTAPAPARPQGALPSAPPEPEPEPQIPSPPPGFGGRTDAHVGMSLGLAPPGLGDSRQLADDSAPDSLMRRDEGGGASVKQTVVHKQPPAKEHPFKQMMREAAEKAAAAKAPATPSPAGEPEVLDAEFEEKTG